MITVRPARDAAQVSADDRLAFRIQRACRLVQDENARIGDERPRDRQTLLLSARQVAGVLFQHGVEAARQPLDEFVGAGQLRGPHHLSEAGVALGAGDVFAHRAAKQEIILEHDAETAAQMGEIEFAGLDPVDAQQAARCRIHAADQPRQRRLAGTAAADDAKNLASARS